MKAAKCDKCGTFFEYGGAHLNCKGWMSAMLGGRLRAGWYPHELDFCPRCMNGLATVMIAWWQAKAEIDG